MSQHDDRWCVETRNVTALHPNSVTESTDAETYVTREFNSGHVVVAAIDNEELCVSLHGGSVS